jgi:RHS repeat-associated protein
VTTNTTTWAITYDANGNRTQVSQSGTARNYITPASSNKLSNLDNPVRSLSHDAAGNRTGDQALFSATFNLANRLSTLTRSGATTTYHYDNEGRRIRKFTSAGTGAGSASTVIFMYDKEGQLLGEYNPLGQAIREYVWFENMPVAMFSPDPAAATNPPLIYFIHPDHLNTPRAVVDKANKIRWRWLAEPFGTTAPETNPSALGVFTQPLRFPGQYADAESSLFYNWNRYYDPTTGRYIESDPIGLARGLNTYAYVGGNPIGYMDRRGLAKDSITASVESAVIRGDARQLQTLIESGALNPSQLQIATQGLRSVDVIGRTTNSTSRLAELFGRSNKQIRSAIEQCKQQGLPRNGPIRNPDVRIDPRTGEVFPEIGQGRVGDSIGNIFDYLNP